MPIENVIQDDGTLHTTVIGLRKGLDTVSAPIDLIPGTVPDIQNVLLRGGYPQRMNGSALHATSMVMPDSVAPTVLALYNPSSGATGTYVAGAQNGHVYSWTGSAWQSLRRNLSTTSGLWWSDCQIGDYLIISNPTDGNYKYDGSNLLPLGAKAIADMESDETWVGGTADTTTVREGIQARSLAATSGGTASMTRTPTTAWNLTSGLLSATNYGTGDSIRFQVNIDNATNLDTALTYIRLGNAADTAYYQLVASSWGTLVNGWNTVTVLKSAFATTGAPNWNSIAKLTFFVDAAAGVNVTCIFDDVYMIYATTMPAGQVNASWKNMFVNSRSTANPSDVNYSKISAPDEWHSSALLPIDLNDGTRVTGLKPYFDHLVVTKDNSIHTISVKTEGTTYPSYTFGTRRVTGEHGGSSHRAMIELAGRLYIWWQQSLFLFQGITSSKMSYIIEPTLRDRETDLLDRFVGGLLRDQNQIRWWYTPNGATQNSLAIIYDYQEGSFITLSGQTMALAKTVFDGGIEYLLTAGYTGRILRQDSGANFDGSDITAQVALPWLSGGRWREVKEWKELNCQYQTQTSGTLIVEYRTANHPREFDAASYTIAASIDMSATDEYGRVRIGERSVWLQVRFRTVGAAFSLYWPVDIYATLLGYKV